MTAAGSAISGAWPYVLAGLLALLVRALLPRDGRRLQRFLRELLLLIPFVLSYFVARGLAAERPALAIANARSLIRLEQALGVFRERQFQQLILQHNVAVVLMNWIYIFGHWPVIIGTFIWLGAKHPDALPRYRNALMLSGAIGFVIFLIHPVAPPRFLPGMGFVDTVSLHSRAYRVLQPQSLEDLYASMPSLHVGWNLLMGIALVREARNPVARSVGLLLPIIMLLAVIATANHYLLDCLAGAAIVVFSYWICGWKNETPRLV